MRLTRRGLLTAAVSAPLVGALAAAREEPVARAAASDHSVRAGGSRTVSISGGYNVWVKEVAVQPGKPAVLTLHGGPGLPHFYLECFEDYLPQAGIGYWYYDQLGCGFSDQPRDAHLWTLERFTAEVEEVRTSLGLEKLVLFGHSWGGMLAIEYALRHPERLAGLVISNMTASIDSYLKRINAQRAQLPAPEARRLRELEKAKAYDSPEYERIVFEGLYRKHICRLDPWPEPVSRAVRWLSAPVYNAMQGQSEFEVTGVLRGWDRWNDLQRITARTLVLGGQFDTMDPEDLRRMSRLLPNASAVICPKGSHLSMYDDQAAYFAALLPFLRETTGIAA
jgi:proline iminopeptidase